MEVRWTGEDISREHIYIVTEKIKGTNIAEV